jgi:WD40 repeat protein
MEKKIVTSSKDHTALVWDANSDTILLELKNHTLQVNTAEFSPDGKRIVTASNDKTVNIWDAETGSLIRTLKGHTYFVTSAVFSPDGKRILTASWDKTIRIWNAETGDSIYSIKKHTGWVHSARYSNDGKKIISASEDGTVKVFDANSFALINDLAVDPYGVNAARFSPNGNKMIMATWGNTCKLWDVATNKMLFAFFPVDSIDYLVADSSYRYDGTQAARNLLYFTCGTEVIQLSQVKDQLWVPGLAEMILKGETVDSKTLYQLGLCGYTPLTKDTVTASGDYRFKITPRGGKLGETVVSVNGIETKKYLPQEIKNSKGEYEVVVKKKDLDSFLIPGKQNTLSVKAYTEDNKITSRGGEVIVNSEEKGPVVMPNLYAVIIGVSDYKGDSLDLKYAGKDATDISAVISKTARKYLNTDGKEHVFIYNLTTEPGNKQVPEKKIIKATFDSVGKKATVNDIFMFVFCRTWPDGWAGE